MRCGVFRGLEHREPVGRRDQPIDQGRHHIVVDVAALEGRHDDRGGLEFVDDAAQDRGSLAQFLRIATFERRHEIEEAKIGLAQACDAPGGARFRLTPRGQCGRLIARQIDDAGRASQMAVAQAQPASANDAIVLVRRQDQQPTWPFPVRPALDHAGSQQSERGEGQKRRIEKCEGQGDPECAGQACRQP